MDNATNGFPASRLSQGAVRWLMQPASALYAGAMRARNAYYNRVRSAVQRAPVPVISVGNVTVGGTGKTPLVIELVRYLREQGRRPAILTRGYKSSHGQPADEVLEFHDAVADVPVVVNADRVAGALSACRSHGADCLVLDDGFQHRRLARDLDIVLIDALDPWGGGCVLPAGRLREPLDALARADAFVLTRVNQVDEATLTSVVRQLHQHAASAPVFSAAIEVDRFIARNGAELPPATLSGQRVLLVCGLGNPQTFVRLMRGLVGRDPAAIPFPDHHRYSARDVTKIADAARLQQADWVVTTRKDWVKLAPQWLDAAPPLVRVDVRLALGGRAAEFQALLRLALERQR